MHEEAVPSATNSQNLKPQTSGKALASLLCGFFSFCLSLLAGVPAVILGVKALRDIRRSQGKLQGSALAMCGILLSSLGMVLTLAVAIVWGLPAVYAARTSARVAESSKNLKQIGLAIHNYHDFHGYLPPAGSQDPSLGLGLSWRVRILPYVEQKPLYDKFDLKSPWDSPQNSALIAQMPKIFKAPAIELPEGQTVYLAVTGSIPGESADWSLRHTAFSRDKRSINFRGIVDGLSNTILVVEADAPEAVVWTKPDDWDFHPDSPRRGLGSVRGTGVAALFADGSTGFVPMTVSDETLRRLFTVADGRPFDDYVPPFFKNHPGARPGRRNR